MKVIGVEIKGREIRLVALSEKNGSIEDATGNYKPMKLEEDDNADNFLLFKIRYMQHLTVSMRI